jgi:hypothetical protein
MNDQPRHITRRRYLALTIQGSFGLAALALAGTATGMAPEPGLDGWLAARLVPDGDPTERDLLSRIIARHLVAGGELASLDAALRSGQISDPFAHPMTGHLDELLAPPLREFLMESARFQRALGLPEGFRLEDACGFSANEDDPPAGRG